MNNSDKPDVYSRVTNKIIADLERGNLTWLQPWQARHRAGPVSRPLRAGGKAYRGVNVLMLWAAAIEKGYSCPLWLTYKQASELGGQVRNGEKGSLVVHADKITKTGTDDKGWVERQVGRSSTFVLAIAVVILWAVSGPVFGWSDTWQLVINTGTTIVTFLMVFVIQNTQSRDTQAMQLKIGRADPGQRSGAKLTDQFGRNVRRRCRTDEGSVRDTRLPEAVTLGSQRASKAVINVA